MRTLVVNGEARQSNAATLAMLLEALDYGGDWLATAVNGEVVPRADRSARHLSDGDRIEILSPMEGG